MWNEIAAWQETLAHRPDLSAKTIALYTQDARRFATWLQSEHPGLKATEVTPIDAKTYRDHLLAKRFAPTTINRALISLMLFFDTIDGTNPFRTVTMIEIVEPAPVALSKTEWNAVRRCAEQAARRDHGLAFALARASGDPGRSCYFLESLARWASLSRSARTSGRTRHS